MARRKLRTSKRSPRKNTFKKEVLFLLIGLVCIFTYLTYTIQQIYALQSTSTPVIQHSNKNSFDQITEITIPRENIDLPVREGTIHSGIWDVNDHGVTHLYSSADPKENGNIVLYGHNLNELFGNIRNLLSGDTIMLKTANNKMFSYTVVSTETVSSSDIAIAEQTNTEILTLYTCTGFADLQRFVVKAIPSK